MSGQQDVTSRLSLSSLYPAELMYLTYICLTSPNRTWWGLRRVGVARLTMLSSFIICQISCEFQTGNIVIELMVSRVCLRGKGRINARAKHRKNVLTSINIYLMAVRSLCEYIF